MLIIIGTYKIFEQLRLILTYMHHNIYSYPVDTFAGPKIYMLIIYTKK